MPADNRFRHQTYTLGPPVGAYEVMAAPTDPPAESDEFGRRVREVATRLADHRVDDIYLAHGTFLGDDALGLITEVEHFTPNLARGIREANKQLKDSVVGYRSNYTAQHADRLERGLRRGGHERVGVRRFHWSSGNHHVARADGAVRLLDELLERPTDGESRVMLWGHSHAGNVFALVTNLLCSPPELVEQFFDAAEPFYRSVLRCRGDLPVWQRVRERLARGERGPRLLIANFGTPVRYGWDTDGCEGLMHFVYHVPNPKLPEYRVAFPPSWDDIVNASAGDVVQQVGIAGSDSPPNWLRLRTRRAYRQLGDLLEANLDDTFLDRLDAGVRVAADGTTLLVNYEHFERRLLCHQGGHAVYTHPLWLLFHAEQTAQRLCP
jgi:hypothetical protein